jgi:hypothetical protein
MVVMAYQVNNQSAPFHRQVHVVLWDESPDGDADDEKQPPSVSSIARREVDDESLKSGVEENPSKKRDVEAGRWKGHRRSDVERRWLAAAVRT